MAILRVFPTLTVGYVDSDFIAASPVLNLPSVLTSSLLVLNGPYPAIRTSLSIGKDIADDREHALHRAPGVALPRPARVISWSSPPLSLQSTCTPGDCIC